jgi:hypothetical protein
VPARRVYRSYLLRCWESAEVDEAGAVERFSVERVSEVSARWVFADFEELVAFLQVELMARPDRQPDDEQSDE